MKLYSGETVHRKLRKEEMYISNPSLGIIGTTTPTTISNNIHLSDMFSGFGARFLQIYNTASYEWKPLRMISKSDETKRDDLVDTLKLLGITFQREKEMVLSDDAKTVYNEWEEKLMNTLVGDSYKSELSSLYGRLQDYGLKFSMLSEIAENWQSISITQTQIEVSEEAIKNSIGIVDSYLDSVRSKAIFSLHDGEMMRVYDKVAEHDSIDRSKLLRSLHMDTKTLASYLSTLMAMDLVKAENISTAGRPRTEYSTTNTGVIE